MRILDYPAMKRANGFDLRFNSKGQGTYGTWLASGALGEARLG